MSCSSWTNSISSCGAGFGQLVAQIVDDLVGERRRLPRGLSRTRMSPLFCCVANRPSSDPVRRVNAAMSGVLLQDLFDLLAACDRSPRARCRPATGSR